MKGDEWFVDFQYYQFGNLIFPKEFSVLHMFNETKCMIFIAKSPSDYNAYAPENMKMEIISMGYTRLSGKMEMLQIGKRN